MQVHGPHHTNVPLGCCPAWAVWSPGPTHHWPGGGAPRRAGHHSGAARPVGGRREHRVVPPLVAHRRRYRPVLLDAPLFLLPGAPSFVERPRWRGRRLTRATPPPSRGRWRLCRSCSHRLGGLRPPRRGIPREVPTGCRPAIRPCRRAPSVAGRKRVSRHPYQRVHGRRRRHRVGGPPPRVEMTKLANASRLTRWSSAGRHCRNFC